MSALVNPQKPLFQTSKIKLSHSRKQCMLTCGKKYQYQYIQRLESETKSANLGYGSAIHTAISAYLTAKAFGADIDPVPIFEREWGEFAQGDVSYSSIWDEQKLLETGRKSLQVFMEDWATRGWTVVLDPNGLPVLERTLEAVLPNGITYTVVLDAMVRDSNDKVIIVDFKTPAQQSMDAFAGLSDQLIGYQVTVEANKAELGIKQVDGLAFYELLKRAVPKTTRGEGPKIHVNEPRMSRTQEDVDDFIRELGFVMQDIQNKRFAKRPMDGFNTPCSMCDFVKLCLRENDPTIRVKENPFSETSVPVQTALVK